MRIFINPKENISVKYEPHYDSKVVVPFEQIDLKIDKISTNISIRQDGFILKDSTFLGNFTYYLDILSATGEKKLYILNVYPEEKTSSKTPCPSFVWETDRDILDTTPGKTSNEILELFGIENDSNSFSIDI